MKRSILAKFSTIFLTIVVLFTLYHYIAKTLSRIYQSATITPSETESAMQETNTVIETTILPENYTIETEEVLLETTFPDSSTDIAIESSVNETTEENSEAETTLPGNDVYFTEPTENEFTVSTESDNTSSNQIGVVTNLNSSVLNVRNEPRTNSERIAGIPNDYLVIVCETIYTSDEINSTWYKIMFKDTVGYVSAKYIDILEDIIPLDSKADENWSLVSTGTTQKISSENREFNIALACSMINEKVILPGELFSWNTTIGGECGKDNGFKEAPVFIMNPDGTIGNGLDYGGGVCQVSTTINIAIKGLGIKTNASPHGKRVSYATLEEEASISYPYTDFSFTNTLDKTIILEMISFKGSCMCNVYVQN